MRKNKLPTIIGIILLIAGIAAGVFLIQNRQIFRLGATPEEVPKDVRITNITGSSFTVSWVTDKQVEGFIKYGKSETSLEKTELDEINGKSHTHFLAIRGLKPQTDYYFEINSGGNKYDNSGSVWKATTGPELAQPSQSNIISGSVLTTSGSPAKNALVYVDVGGGVSLTTVTSDSGSWLIAISSVRTKDLSSYIQIDPANTVVEISVQTGSLGIGSAQIYPQSAKPAPPIILGEVKDFKNLPPNETGEMPEASVNLPDTATASSKFEVDETSKPETSETVTLESIKEGETVTSTKPEFFGEGPPSTKITITVESDPVSDDIAVSGEGSWNWSPPENLSEGIHKITISWRDADGILRTLTRTFVVQAAEGPSFESTPSATTTPTPTLSPNPTASSTATPAPTSTASATSVPIPDSGSLTPTYLLTIMGVGLLGLSAVATFLVLQKK